MTSYLLDTNIISDLIRNPAGVVAARIAREGEGSLATSVIVAAELRFGVAKAGNAVFRGRVETALTLIPVLPLATPADLHYGQVRAVLERRGTPIGANDLLIAAHALATGRVMVTGNESEFRQVPGLMVENWLVGAE